MHPSGKQRQPRLLGCLPYRPVVIGAVLLVLIHAVLSLAALMVPSLHHYQYISATVSAVSAYLSAALSIMGTILASVGLMAAIRSSVCGLRLLSSYVFVELISSVLIYAIDMAGFCAALHLRTEHRFGVSESTEENLSRQCRDKRMAYSAVWCALFAWRCVVLWLLKVHTHRLQCDVLSARRAKMRSEASKLYIQNYHHTYQAADTTQPPPAPAPSAER
ncbi:unnamed protein product [Vitrella brassicaformis CCMP3155]|uniref:MARVEL domain-containing protein n=1 Tax=Vitrella brassicaformis (strain CCMP3155) TaxID=1169540 RepID=A0A0G4F1I1_VITBC|nr:unnamed protein product [Vitrella brassicaformis CCMP3155]|eukprot:CEM05583.1 unnamed protein product [Vitrella brassicaformis CCMP3155]